MQVEVDQSIRIDNTQKATVLVMAGRNLTKSVLISAIVKRQLLKILRRHGQKGDTIYLNIFTALLYILLRDHLDKITHIVIDTEFSGNHQQAQIVERLIQYARADEGSLQKYQISFTQVTKKSPAHELAIAVHREETEVDQKISWEDIAPYVL